jgi:integrase
MQTVSLKKYVHPRYNWRVRWVEAGKDTQKPFKKKVDAQRFADARKAELTALGSKHAQITEAERRAVHAFRDLMLNKPSHMSEVTLDDVVRDYGKSMERRFEPLSVEMVADKLLSMLTAEGKSKSHITTLGYRLKPFIAEYGDRLTANITTDIIDDYLTHADVGAQTKKHYRVALMQMFKHAIKLKASDANPVEDAMMPKVVRSEAGVLKPKDVANLLTCAEDFILPALAIHFFAGLRRSEVERLDWSEINLDEKEIEVKGEKAKGAKRRIVPMSDNLCAWLTPLAQHEGAVIGSGYLYREGIMKARRVADLVEGYPHNAGRHSYASYHLAKNKHAGELAVNLGHPDPTMLYSHYRAMVTPKDAATYWSITPTAAKNIINIKDKKAS